MRISNLGDEDLEFLVLIHELVESYLCKVRGIEFDEIDAFDKGHPELDEPGESSEAPYHKEHLFAESIEKQLAQELKVDWNLYMERIQEVSSKEPRSDEFKFDQSAG